MSPLTASIFVFACAFGGALLGMFVQRLLPKHQLSTDSKEVVRLAMGLVATTVALVLGLLVASAKSFYDTQNTEVTQLSANVLLLDRVLAHYGPETADARAALQNMVAREIDLLWPQNGDHQGGQLAIQVGQVMLDKIQALSPKDEWQRFLQSQALGCRDKSPFPSCC